MHRKAAANPCISWAKSAKYSVADDNNDSTVINYTEVVIKVARDEKTTQALLERSSHDVFSFNVDKIIKIIILCLLWGKKPLNQPKTKQTTVYKYKKRPNTLLQMIFLSGLKVRYRKFTLIIFLEIIITTNQSK